MGDHHLFASAVPLSRVRRLNDAPIRGEREWVLYWMTSARRLRCNFALERAVEWAVELKKPLLVLEALRCDYPWASDRLHRFVLDGMADKIHTAAVRPFRYFAFVEPERGADRGLLAEVASRSAVVVTDDTPVFFLPGLVDAAVRVLDVAAEGVDGNGLLPLSAVQKDFKSAYHFRRLLQRELPRHLEALPLDDPLENEALVDPPLMPREWIERWPPGGSVMLPGNATGLADLPIDHQVAPVSTPGGATAADARLELFLTELLDRYADERNHPTADATSGLSPYLHFGFISPHQVFRDLMLAEGWSLEDLGARTDGRREGWWGVSRPAEAFLDQLVTWRELGSVTSRHLPGYERYESLPEWALKTLEDHAGDPREHLYSLEELGAAQTHDPLWNAAQRQLMKEGRIHNYLRMLWGKKILEWTRHPQEAHQIMVELNNRWALDGRDPSSYSGISWVLGRYDRPFGPERPVFGKVRYMSSTNTARKLPVKDYLARYG